MSLVPKVAILRLDFEQIQHITDGLVKNREDIEESCLGLYDEKMNDVFDQLNRQGIEVIRVND